MFGVITGLFGKTSIRSRVMRVIDERIQNAQKDYDEKASQLDETLENDIEKLRKDNINKKGELADTLVKEVFNVR